MPARNPEDVDQQLAEAFRARDLEAVVMLYEPGATFVAQPGQSMTGQAAIRAAVQGFLALQPDLRIKVTRVIRSGDLALLSSTWTLAGTGPDGEPLQLSGIGAEVVRRQPDGSWRSFDSHHGLWPWARSGFRPTGASKGTTGSARGAPYVIDNPYAGS